jgi:branched-chain amino acid transport system permease protein
VEYFIHIAILVMLYSILGLSFNLLMGYAGLFSLAHAAMFGLGAYASALLAVHLGLNIFLVMLFAAVITAAIGALFAIPAARTKSHYLVVLSFGFQMVIFYLMMNWISLTGGEGGITGIPRPTLIGVTIGRGGGFLTLTLVLAVLCFLASRRIARSPFGRVLKAMRDDEEATRALGKNVLGYKVVIFMVTGALAAVAGSLYAHYITFINPFTFSLSESIFILAIVVFGGMANLWGSVVGAVVLVSIPELLRFVPGSAQYVGALRNIIYGGMLILLMAFRSEGLLPEYAGRKFRGLGAVPEAAATKPVAPQSQLTSAPHPAQAPVKVADAPILEVAELSKAFGGLQAVNRMTLGLAEGHITGLIGPNGAGKSTFFNLVTGFLQPDGGKVHYRGRDITGQPPERVTAQGIARSWQDIRLFRRMTVLDTVRVAQPAQRGENILFALSPYQGGTGEAHLRAQQWLDFVGLTGKDDELAGNLSFAEQKLLSLARILATEADLLLLDEPTSGLDTASIDRILDLIRSMAQQGKTVCIVEHNLDVIRGTADRAFFLAEGQVIASGTPDELFADRRLAEIYFGGG